MSIGTMWSRAWRDYRMNISTNTRIMCTYYLVPLILAIGVVLALVLGSGFIEQWNGITVLADVNSSALDT